MHFPIAYADSERPLPFTDSLGNTTLVRAFGIRTIDANRFYELRGQPQVLFLDGEDNPDQFAVDLWKKSPEIQVVFARIDRADTLADTIANVQTKASRMRARPMAPSDVMLIPNMNWQVSHRFSARNPPRRRDASFPFFAVWVETSELLERW
jgi:hypothetical protein